MKTDTKEDIDDETEVNSGTFYDSLHVKYITSLGKKLDAPTSYEGAVTSHLKMSGIYWSLTALSILRSSNDVNSFMKLKSNVLDFVFQCYDADAGGFGGNVGHDAHLLYTLSAIQIIALAGQMDDERLDKLKTAQFISSLQLEDGSFMGDQWGEVDTRFSYCALSALSLLGFLYPSNKGEDENGSNGSDHPYESKYVNVEKAAKYIASCHNFDGGFGCIPGAESHAGQVFCCVGALAISGYLSLLIPSEKQSTSNANADLLSWWLSERQCDSGGLNGRPEKQADVCYSWWILSALVILGRVDWINKDKLVDFILKCQDDDDGGIADRPQDMPDVFHTFFGISGLSLLGHLHGEREGSNEFQASTYRKIDPVYALPTDIVQELNLGGQVLVYEGEPLDIRLKSYQVVTVKKK